jgi:hypothetical protein
MLPIMDDYYSFARKLIGKITDFSYTSRTKRTNEANLEMV